MKRVPIFPLPNTVFFPRVKMSLHIFEPRYRQMTADALSGERLIVIVLLRPGWEEEYYESPPVHETATLGYLEQYEQLPDGRYNILLDGLERVRLVEGPADAEALPQEKLYRLSWVASAPEKMPHAGSPAEVEGRIRLRSLWQKLIDESGIHDAEQSDIRTEAPFDELVNQMATYAGLSTETKQSLLELDDLIARGKGLESALQEQLKYWSTLNKFRELAPEDPHLN
jgi:Lon protease-like protein